jgi:hypothetical protein
MLVDEIRKEIVHPGIRDLHGDGGDVLDGTEDREVEGLAGVDLDDVHVAHLAVLEPREELRLLLDRGNRRAQADADEVFAGLAPQPLEADRQ